MLPNTVERRKNERIPTDELAVITVLCTGGSRQTGQVNDVSSTGLRLLLDRPIPLSTPVRIDVFDTMLLGEACYCTLIDGSYHTGVVLSHVLANVEELAQLAAVW